MEELKTENLLNLEETIAKGIFRESKYPWEIIPSIKDYILELGKKLDKNIFEEKGENIWIAKSAKVSPTAYINGPVIIDEEAEIRHCAFIRGNAIIGKGAVVGNSTEVKNAIIFNKVQIPHYNYVGDSILGYKAHMGASSILSNVRSDKKNATIKYNGEKIETNLRKMGSILGDEAEIGCGAILNPGTIIARKKIVYPLTSVSGYIK